jgi:hypothetical protein
MLVLVVVAEHFMGLLLLLWKFVLTLRVGRW